MLVKIIILFLFTLIFLSLTSALFSLRNSKSSIKMAKALTWRISLSLAVFFFLLLAFALGWIQPHGLK